MSVPYIDTNVLDIAGAYQKSIPGTPKRVLTQAQRQRLRMKKYKEAHALERERLQRAREQEEREREEEERSNTFEEPEDEPDALPGVHDLSLDGSVSYEPRAPVGRVQELLTDSGVLSAPSPATPSSIGFRLSSYASPLLHEHHQFRTPSPTLTPSTPPPFAKEFLITRATVPLSPPRVPSLPSSSPSRLRPAAPISPPLPRLPDSPPLSRTAIPPTPPRQFLSPRPMLSTPPATARPSLPQSPPLLPATPPPAIRARARNSFPLSPPRLPPSTSALPFKDIRAELICQIHLDVLSGGSFADTHVHLYSRRNRAGLPYAPKELALNRRILQAASSEFDDYVFADHFPVDSDGYLDDSDLEDEEDTESDMPGSLTVASLTDSFDDREPVTPRTEEDITTRLGDADLMTDDEDERNRRRSGTSTPSRRSLPGQIVVEQRVLDGAYKTWQAMSLFLYTDHINFNPLRSYATCVPHVHSRWDDKSRHVPCSPKSMYRLADRLRLWDLKEQSQAFIKSCLTEQNIVDELFSDFTWRYPDILQMQTEIFSQHSTHPAVTSAMRRVFARIAKGELPHSDVVLEYLFGKLTGSGDVSVQ